MFFIKKFPVPRWESIPDPWVSSRACIRCSMAALTKPGVENVLIHTVLPMAENEVTKSGF